MHPTCNKAFLPPPLETVPEKTSSVLLRPYVNQHPRVTMQWHGTMVKGAIVFYCLEWEMEKINSKDDCPFPE